MRKAQATKANAAQVAQHIRRQRRGEASLEFAHRYPVLDAVCGGLMLAAAMGTVALVWIKVGAGV